jgi:alpha,alpha-trehalase
LGEQTQQRDGTRHADHPARRFHPHVLRDYALIADGERGALVSPRGDIVWMCAPRWDSDAVFSALIGGDGVYAVTPAHTFVWGGYYEEGTLIWRSRWITGDGVTECHEALAFPGDPGRVVVLRQIVARTCPAEVEIVLDLRAGFGQHGLRSVKRGEDGAWTGRAGDLHVRWSGDTADATARQAGRARVLTMDLTVPPGQSRDLVLELSAEPLRDARPDPARLWRSTRERWVQASPRLDGVVAPRDARQAQVVLRGLTGSGGGMVAAATTSLPERAEEGRNYDYRYAWIRDQVYAGRAAAAVGSYPLLDQATAFISARLHDDGPKLVPAYTIDGGPVPDQRRLNLPGYPGGFDLVGNWVNRQFQLDALGESLLLLAAAGSRDRLDSDGRRAAEIAAAAIGQRWREDDAGMWELDDQAWTHSRLTCSAGLRAAARNCTTAPQASEWSELADAILADTAAHAVHPSGRWQRSADDAGLDAALLIPPIRGAVPADDPRTVETLRAYIDGLTQDGYAYRFRHDERPLGEAEGAFLLCGFVLALAEHHQGHELEAVRWFERSRAACGSPGLYAEEYDVAERQLRGNLPQAFVHAMVLECAARLAEPWHEW